MKKLIKRVFSFTLFFAFFSILVNSLFLGIIAQTDWDFVKRLESLRFVNPDYELLVLGTSLAEYGVDTELLTSKGVKSFNLTMVGSSMKTCYIQLNEYLTIYSIRPKYVLLSVNSYLEQFDQKGIQPVVEFTMKDHKYSMKDIPISKFGWAGMEIPKKIIRKQYRETCVSYGQKKSIIIEPDNSNCSAELIIDLQKYNSALWIAEIVKLCCVNGIECIVMDVPGIKETQNISEIGPYTLQFENGYSALLYNFNSRGFCKFIDADRDWCGRSHFNKYGAEKFTKEIIRIIFKNQ